MVRSSNQSCVTICHRPHCAATKEMASLIPAVEKCAYATSAHNAPHGPRCYSRREGNSPTPVYSVVGTYPRSSITTQGALRRATYLIKDDTAYVARSQAGFAAHCTAYRSSPTLNVRAKQNIPALASFSGVAYGVRFAEVSSLFIPVADRPTGSFYTRQAASVHEGQLILWRLHRSRGYRQCMPDACRTVVILSS